MRVLCVAKDVPIAEGKDFVLRQKTVVYKVPKIGSNRKKNSSKSKSPINAKMETNGFPSKKSFN